MHIIKNKYVEKIKKTRFLLEYRVCSILEKHGWKVGCLFNPIYQYPTKQVWGGNKRVTQSKKTVH